VLRELPSLPKPDRNGNYRPSSFGCATIARDIIRDRVKAGLNQKGTGQAGRHFAPRLFAALKPVGTFPPSDDREDRTGH